MTRFVIQTYATVPSRLAVRLCLVDAREKDDVAPQSPTRVAVSTMSTLARPRAASAIVPRASSSRARASSRRACVARAGKQSFIDGVIDMLEGGRKLRRWYGSDSSVGDGTRVDDDPVDGDDLETSEEDERDVELDTPKTAVLVTNAVGGVGEAVVMRLVLAKATVVASVDEDRIALAETRFGPYVNVASNEWSAGARLNGVRAVVVAGALEDDLLDACVRRGVKHLVLVSSAKSASGGLFADADARVRGDRGREARAAASGLAVTVVRPCAVRREPGGAREIVLGQGDDMSGDVSVEDLAETCARALTRPPSPGRTLAFEVRNGAPSSSAPNWKAMFASLKMA